MNLIAVAFQAFGQKVQNSYFAEQVFMAVFEGINLSFV